MLNLNLNQTNQSFFNMLHNLKDKKESRMYYYSLKSLSHIYNGQLTIFLQECEKDGFLLLKDNCVSLLPLGIAAVDTGDIKALKTTYDKALNKIKRLYTDVLI